MNRICTATAISLLSAVTLIAQSGGTYNIDRSVISGGGGAAVGGSFILTGTIGQPIAGSSNGGQFSASAGFWTAAPVAPTAATVAVGGRVLDPVGIPLRNALVVMTNSSGTVFATRTNSAGFFLFDEVLAGDAYVVEISARGRQFVPVVLNVRDAISGLEFRPIN